jgi:hypothetical protein
MITRADCTYCCGQGIVEVDSSRNGNRRVDIGGDVFLAAKRDVSRGFRPFLPLRKHLRQYRSDANGQVIYWVPNSMENRYQPSHRQKVDVHADLFPFEVDPPKMEKLSTLYRVPYKYTSRV